MERESWLTRQREAGFRARWNGNEAGRAQAAPNEDHASQRLLKSPLRWGVGQGRYLNLKLPYWPGEQTQNTVLCVDAKPTMECGWV